MPYKREREREIYYPYILAFAFSQFLDLFFNIKVHIVELFYYIGHRKEVPSYMNSHMFLL